MPFSCAIAQVFVLFGTNTLIFSLRLHKKAQAMKVSWGPSVSMGECMGEFIIRPRSEPCMGDGISLCKHDQGFRESKHRAYHEHT
eukprot:1147536-Pelagomonas_calceolata.AAC.5